MYGGISGMFCSICSVGSVSGVLRVLEAATCTVLLEDLTEPSLYKDVRVFSCWPSTAFVASHCNSSAAAHLASISRMPS